MTAPEPTGITIDTIPVDLLHVTCMAHDRMSLLDAAIRAARLYFGPTVELQWAEAKVQYIGSNDDTWELDAWCRTKNEGPFITSTGEVAS